MKIPVNASNDYHCKNCNGIDFGFLQKGAQLGIYCSRCGRWLKWADKDEQNLYEMNKPGQDNVANVLNKIRAEIEALPKTYPFVDHIDTYVKEDDVKEIIDKYKTESEE